MNCRQCDWYTSDPQGEIGWCEHLGRITAENDRCEMWEEGVASPPLPDPPKRPGRQRIHADGAARTRAYRARKGVKAVTLNLKPETIQAVNEFLKYKDYGWSELVEKLLQTQVLRKR